MSLSGTRVHRSSVGFVTEQLEARQFLSAAPTVHVRNLVSDGAFPALHKDPDLVNPWGVSFDDDGPFWISDNGTGKTTLYDGNGVKQKLVVTIPGITAGSSSAPTGQVYNVFDKGFDIGKNGETAPSVFIFTTEDGTISGWNPTIDPTHAINAVKNPNAIYKGLALASGASGPELFAANFHQGTVNVFDKHFHSVNLGADAFKDSSIPLGYAPFNVENIGGKIFVTFAKQDAEKHDDAAGTHHGFVDVFDTSGKLLQRFQAGNWLNSPWGMAVAPSSYGKYAGSLLVGNFGSGLIDVFDMKTGNFVSFLKDSKGNPIHEAGLWALTPGTGGATESEDAIYFTAGPNDESDGLFGELVIDPVVV